MSVYRPGCLEGDPLEAIALVTADEVGEALPAGAGRKAITLSGFEATEQLKAMAASDAVMVLIKTEMVSLVYTPLAASPKNWPKLVPTCRSFTHVHAGGQIGVVVGRLPSGWLSSMASGTVS